MFSILLDDEFSDGMSLARGWRWPTGAPINRISGISDEDCVAGPTDDFAFPVVCAIAAGLRSTASNVIVVIKFRIIASPELARVVIAGAARRQMEVGSYSGACISC
jgi:hypothetical protein